MDLFIANCTNQVRVFHFRIPEMPSPWQVTIPIGGQVKLPAPPGGFNPPQAEYVMKQLRKAGGAPLHERSNQRISLLWSEKPIPVTPLYLAVEENQSRLKVDGEQLRKEAAVAVDSQVQALGDVHHFQPPEAIEMTVVEEESKSNPSPQFGEALRVSKTEQPGASPAPSGRRGKRAA